MEEQSLLMQLQAGDAAALETAIHIYGGYVYTVIQGRSRGCLPPEDLEELTADVFVTLWQKAQQVTPGYLRGWLGSVARNSTVDRLRRRGVTLPLEEETLTVSDPLWERLLLRERTQLVQEALFTMCAQDREIFIRYYDWNETMNTIAESMGLSASAVKMRLHRGRKQMKQYFTERGISIEDYI